MEVLVVVGLLAFIPAFIAKNKGRNPVLWWIYGFAFFIIALIHSLLLKDKSGPSFREREEERRAARRAVRSE